MSIYNNTNAKRVNNVAPDNARQSLFEMTSTWIQSSSPKSNNSDMLDVQHGKSANASGTNVSTRDATDKSLSSSDQLNKLRYVGTLSSSSLNAGHFGRLQSPIQPTLELGHNGRFGESASNFTDWSRVYLAGREHGTEIPRVLKLP